jgi:hypothetical protein
MSQYSNTTTSAESGVIVNAVLDSITNTITWTATAPNGAVASTVQSANVRFNTTVPGGSPLLVLSQQLRAQGVQRTGLTFALDEAQESVERQRTTATAAAAATNTSVPAAPSPPVPSIQTPAGPAPAVGENAAVAATQAVSTPAVVPINDPTGVLAAEDAAIAEQEAAQSDADAFAGLATVRDPTGVLAAEDAAIAEQAAADSDAEAFGPTTFGPAPPPPGTGYGDDQEEFTTDSLGNTYRNGQLFRAAEAEEDITQRDAFKTFANQQATLRARYVEPSSQDWRVRLVLAGGANYLYEDDNNSILKPLQDSNGVIFPYTPQISTSYNASYDETQLTHSNYRGYFYKGSHVGDINITGTFTAQDTKEAQYLLAVIHFFRSVTKMFYGQDAQRGTPPPLVYLIGFGEMQFNGHACLVSQFSYNLPSDVDYIRATGFNNYGVNLLNRRAQASQSFPGSSLLGSTSRLLASKLLGTPGAEPARPDPGPVTGGVSNTVRSTYVPTKMEIALTLKPVQSRAQMSREFSLKNFANGNLLKGGYW